MSPLRLPIFIGLLMAVAGCSGDAAILDPGPDLDPNPDTYPYPVGKVFFTHPPIGLEGVLFFEMYPSRSGFAGQFPNWTLEDTGGLDESTQTESILLVEMLDGETVRLERFDGPGISPDEVTGFTVNARTFKRNPVG